MRKKTGTLTRDCFLFITKKMRKKTATAKNAISGAKEFSRPSAGNLAIVVTPLLQTEA